MPCQSGAVIALLSAPAFPISGTICPACAWYPTVEPHGSESRTSSMGWPTQYHRGRAAVKQKCFGALRRQVLVQARIAGKVTAVQLGVQQLFQHTLGGSAAADIHQQHRAIRQARLFQICSCLLCPPAQRSLPAACCGPQGPVASLWCGTARGVCAGHRFWWCVLRESKPR